MKYLYRLLFCVLIFSCMSFTNDEQPKSYNYSRAMEALQKENYDEAVEYLNKELQENSKNGYAYFWLGIIDSGKDKLGSALTAFNKSIKYLPKKDVRFISSSFSERANVYYKLEKVDKAIEDLNQAIDCDGENTDFYEKRAQVYYELEDYEKADKDYRKIIDLDEGSVMGYMGLGRNAFAQERYDEAIESYNYVMNLANNYSSSYSFRSECFMKQGKFNEAADDIITALSIDGDDKAFYLMQSLADSSFVTLSSKLNIQSMKQPNNYYWLYCLALIHENAKSYHKAIDYYEKAFNLNRMAITAYRMSVCYEFVGDYDKALDHVNFALEQDSTESQFLLQKANLYYEKGDSKKAIDGLGHFIKMYPEYYFGYYRRGFFKDNTGDIDGALEDYSMSIIQNPNDAYSYLGRGDMYMKKGQKDLARKDYVKVIELDTVPENSSCAQYAYSELGKKKEAIEFMNKILEKDSLEAGNYYDAACLYARMNDADKSLYYIEKSFEKGFRNFNHIINDDDLNLIKDTEVFKELFNKYKEKIEGEMKQVSGVAYEERIVEIPYIDEGGVYKVKCTINNLPLYFIFDTGASSVSMSNVEAAFMLKNDYLSGDDFQGSQNYVNADGGISEGTVVNLRHVEFAGLDLANIEAGIVKNQKAPLLLGQSVLKKLGKIEINNEDKVIKITYKKMVK